MKTNDVLVGTVAAYDVSTFYSLFPFRKSRQMEYRSVQQSVQYRSVEGRDNVGSDISQDHRLTILKTILLKCYILN